MLKDSVPAENLKVGNKKFPNLTLEGAMPKFHNGIEGVDVTIHTKRGMSIRLMMSLILLAVHFSTLPCLSFRAKPVYTRGGGGQCMHGHYTTPRGAPAGSRLYA